MPTGPAVPLWHSAPRSEVTPPKPLSGRFLRRIPRLETRKKRKTGGRRKGTPNKLTATARENILAVFTRLGGVDAMAEWARENPTEFYKLYARLIPMQWQPEFVTLEQVIAEARDQPLKPLPEHLRLDASTSTVADAEIVGRPAVGD